MKTMTSRERMMLALTNKEADRVPCAPDISNMIPCRLTKKPFWDIYVNNNPPLGNAYLDAVKYFDIDGWYTYGCINFKTESKITTDRHVIKKTDKHWLVRDIYHTPIGDLEATIINPVSNSPTSVEKIIKNFKEDFPKIKHLLSNIVGYDATYFEQQKKELGELGIMCVCISPPGLHVLVDWFHGNLEAATYAYYDHPELFEELRELFERQSLQMVEMALECKTDSILTGGSGSITLQSPKIWTELSLPTLKKITKMCKEAGVISGIHSCGKERYLTEICAKETDLDYINPLEIAPMGDCTLSEVKEKFGKKLALMGNIHTTNVMLNGSVDLVRLECLKAIRDAGMNGGFVLSTGDQCGRDTPDENIFAMVKIAKEFGCYPLNLDKINEEIKIIEKKISK